MTGRRKLSIGLGLVGFGSVVAGVALAVSGEIKYADAKAEHELARRTELTDAANLRRGLALGAGLAGIVTGTLSVYLWRTGGTRSHATAHRRVAILLPILDGDAVGFAIMGGM